VHPILRYWVSYGEYSKQVALGSSMLVLVVLFSALANHTSSAEATGGPSVLCSLDLFELRACYPCQVSGKFADLQWKKASHAGEAMEYAIH
jgi:hypothetical protein